MMGFCSDSNQLYLQLSAVNTQPVLTLYDYVIVVLIICAHDNSLMHAVVMC